MAGTYDERVNISKSGSSNNNIFFEAKDGVSTNGFTVTGDYIQIKGFTVTSKDCSNAGIKILGNYSVIENNIAYFSGWGGISTDLNSKNAIIRNNKAHKNGMVGIEISGYNHLIENNEIWETIEHHPVNNCGSEKWRDADGIRFFGSGHIFKNNYIHDIKYGPPGINISIGDLVDDAHIDCFQTWNWGPEGKVAGNNIIFEKNNCDLLGQSQAQNEHAHGFMLEGAQGITIKNNIIRTYGGINTGGGGNNNLNILNNIFVNDPTLTRFWPNAIGLGSMRAIIKNNIFYNQPYHTVNIIGDTTNVEVDYNLAYNENGSTPRCVLWGNFDTCQPKKHNLWNVNPLFVNPASGDYHLQSGSPAKNSGENLGSLVENDFDNNSRPQGSGYDIGAFEYVENEINPTLTPAPTNKPTPTNTPTPKPTNTPTPRPTSTPTPTKTPTPTPTNTPTPTPRPTSTPTPSPTPTPVGLVVGQYFEAEKGLISQPFITQSGTVYQTRYTDQKNGGQAIYDFYLNKKGRYIIKAIINAPNTGANSFFVNIDSQPTDPNMVWDIITLTDGLQERTVSQRGSGSYDKNQYSPMVFNLEPGKHQLVIRGREANTKIDKIKIEEYPMTKIVIFAAGTQAYQVYPSLQLLIDDKKIAEWANIQGNPQTRTFQEIIYYYPAQLNSNQIKIKYFNDAYDKANKNDRNLMIDKITLNDFPYESEASSVYSVGSWTNNGGCNAGYKKSEWLHCTGYFQY